MGLNFDANEIEMLMSRSRARTRELFGVVISEADLRRPPAEGFRPLLWHLGHLGAFEGYWILQRAKGDPPISPRYDVIFDPLKTPRDDSKDLPPVAEIESYLARVRDEALAFLAGFDPRDPDSLFSGGYMFDLVIEHEYQHQETVAYLLQMLRPESKRKPSTAPDSSPILRPSSFNEMVRVAGGPFEMGSGGEHFSYDNERPPVAVELSDYRLDKYPVTNREFAQFIEAGGYETRSLWSEEGWAWKEENNIRCPLYWSADEMNGGWRAREMFEERAVRPDHPVVGVSWHEAESYVRLVGKRLPTEAEWERAAAWDERTSTKRRYSWGDEPPRAELANFDNNHWGATAVGAFPEGRSAAGCFDMTGNVWEWTASVFSPYPGFQPDPYREYSEPWFDGDHRVLKGGSWMTRPPLLRCSFRNFFRPRFRYAFAGFRCAAD